jgi:GTP-binding protein
VQDFDTINEELRLFAPHVAAKPQVVAANKIDALDEPERVRALEQHVTASGLPLLRISAVTGDGLDALLETLWREIVSARAAEAAAVDTTDDDSGVDLITPGRARRE